MLTPSNTLIIYDTEAYDFVAKVPADIDYSKAPWITLVDPATNPKRTMRWTPSLFDPVAKIWLISADLQLDLHGQ